MKLGVKYSLMTVFTVIILSFFLEGISLHLFSGKIHALSLDLFEEKLDRLVNSAYLQDELFFEGVYSDESVGRLRLIDKQRVDYRLLKDQVSYVFIIDTQGRTLLHPAESRWGGAFPWKVEKGQQIFDESVMKMIREKKQGEFEYTWHGVKKWCVFKIYEPWGWVFCQTTSVAEKNKVLVSFMWLAGSVSFLIIALSVFVSTGMSRKFIRPLNVVIGQLQKIARGEITFRTIRTDKAPNDEIGMLDWTVNKMAEDLSRVTVSRDHFDNILNAAAEGILGLDLQGKHTFVNPAAAKMLGYDAEFLVGRPSHSLWHHTKANGSPYPLEECPILGAILKGMMFQRNGEVLWRKDGTRFLADLTSTPIRSNGVIAGVVVTFSDVTAQMRMEEEREKQFRELKIFSESSMNREERILELKKKVVELEEKLEERTS